MASSTLTSPRRSRKRLGDLFARRKDSASPSHSSCSSPAPSLGAIPQPQPRTQPEPQPQLQLQLQPQASGHPANPPPLPPLPLPTFTISSDREEKISRPHNVPEFRALSLPLGDFVLTHQKVAFDEDFSTVEPEMSSKSEREGDSSALSSSNAPRTPSGSGGQKALSGGGNTSKWRAAISDQKIRRELDLAIELSEFEKARGLVEKRPKVLSVPNEENLLPADVALLLHRWELYEWLRANGGDLSYELLCDYGRLLEHLREDTEQVNLQILQLTAKIFGDNDAAQREPARGFEKELSLIEKRNRRLKHMIAKLNALPPTPPPAHLQAEVISDSALRIKLHAEPDAELIRFVGRPANYVPLLGFRIECAEDDCFATIARQVCEHCAGCENVFTRVLRGLVHAKRYYIRAQLLGLRGWSASAYLSAPHFVTITGWADARRISAIGAGERRKTSSSLLEFSAVKIKHIADTSFNNFTVELNSCFVPRAGVSHERERERERPLASKSKSPGVERRQQVSTAKRSRSPPFSASGQFQQLFNLINVISTGAPGASCRSDSKSPLVAWLASNPFKFTKLTKPGVYLCPIFYQDPRIACTADEVLPLVLLDENHLSLNLNAEIGALQKLLGDMGSLRFLLKSVNRMSCPPSIEFRLKVLNTIAELTGALDAQSPSGDSQNRAFTDCAHAYTLALYGQVFEGAMGARESSVLVCCICARSAAASSNQNEERSNNEATAAATAGVAPAAVTSQAASAALPAGLHWVAYTKFLKKRHRNGVLQMHGGMSGSGSPSPAERLLSPPTFSKSRLNSSSSREFSGRPHLQSGSSFDESSLVSSSSFDSIDPPSNSSNSSTGTNTSVSAAAKSGNAGMRAEASAARSGAAAVGEAYEQLLRGLEDVIVYTRGLSQPLSAGLYVAYLQMYSTLEQIRLLVPRHQPHMLPAIKVRENAHVNADEWLLLQELSRAQHRRSCREKLSAGLAVPVRPRSSPDNRDDQEGGGRSAENTNAHANLPAPLIKFKKELLQGIMKLLEYVKEDACDSDAKTSEHYIYLNEVIELDAHVSLILVVPPRDEICTMDERVSGGAPSVSSVLPPLIPTGALQLLRAHKKSLQVPAPPLLQTQSQGQTQSVVAYATDNRSTSTWSPNASACLQSSLSVCEEKTHLMQVYISSFELIMTALYESAAVRKCVALLNTVEFAAQILAHMQRGFLVTADIQEMRARLRRLATMQERLEEVWRVQRWLPELIARARDKHGKEQLVLLPVNYLRTERHSSPLGRSIRTSTSNAPIASEQLARVVTPPELSVQSAPLPQHADDRCEKPTDTTSEVDTNPPESGGLTSAELAGGVSNELNLVPEKQQIGGTVAEEAIHSHISPSHTCSHQADYNYEYNNIEESTTETSPQITSMSASHAQVHVQPDNHLVELENVSAQRSGSQSPSAISSSSSSSPDAASEVAASASADASRAAGDSAENHCRSDPEARNLAACVNSELPPQSLEGNSSSAAADCSTASTDASTSALCTSSGNSTSPLVASASASGDIRTSIAASNSSLDTFGVTGAGATLSSTCSAHMSIFTNVVPEAPATIQSTRARSTRTTPSPPVAECSSSSASNFTQAAKNEWIRPRGRTESDASSSTVASQIASQLVRAREDGDGLASTSVAAAASTSTPRNAHEENSARFASSFGSLFLKHTASHRSSYAVSPLPRLLSRHSHFRSHKLIGSRSESGGESDSSSDFGSFFRAESLHDEA